LKKPHEWLFFIGCCYINKTYTYFFSKVGYTLKHMNTMEQKTTSTESNEGGLMAQLQPGKDKITALQKVMATLNNNPNKSFQDEVDLRTMGEEIASLVKEQAKIMDTYDKKYITGSPEDKDIWSTPGLTNGNTNKDLGQSAVGF
jgi:hypothetical protein